jgi:4-amino-4-deoxy-L-arabinose transferase-like glycosyltransferase
LVFALAESLFGRHMWSVRILDLPILIAGMSALGFITARVTSRMVGYWAALSYLVFLGYLTWFHTAEPDAWAGSFIILGVASLFGRRVSSAQLLISGVMIGCAGLVKPSFLAFGAVLVTYIICERPFGREWLLATASVAGAALLPLAIAAAWFAWRGALGDLIDVHLLYPAKVYAGLASVHAGTLARGFFRYFFAGPILFGIPVIGIGAYSLWRNSRSTAWMVFIWFAMSILCVAAQAKFFKYHWIPLFAPLIILAAVGCDSLLAGFSGKRQAQSTPPPRALAAACLLLAAYGLLQLVRVPASDVAKWSSLLAGRITTEQYYAAHTASWFVAGETMKAARHIEERTRPTDGLAVFGNEALVNFLSGRPNPTRFLTGGSLTLGGQSPVRNAYRLEYIKGLRDRPPAYIVVGMAFNATKEVALKGFPELQSLLDQRYSLETSFGYLDLYHQNDPDMRLLDASVSQ